MSTYSLAFMGDAVYEALARSYIVANSQSTVGRLHLDKLEIVNASAQFRAAKVIFDYLTEDERQIFLRGRNAHNAHIPKNKSAEEYRYATALEALFGYLYLSGKTDRLHIIRYYYEDIMSEKTIKRRIALPRTLWAACGGRVFLYCGKRAYAISVNCFTAPNHIAPGE